jgi:hypothetical protein
MIRLLPDMPAGVLGLEVVDDVERHVARPGAGVPLADPEAAKTWAARTD